MKAVAALPLITALAACSLNPRVNLEEELDYSNLHPIVRNSDRAYGHRVVSVLKKHAGIRRAYAIWSARSDKVYVVIDSEQSDISNINKSIESLDKEWPEVDLLLVKATPQDMAMLKEKLAPFYIR